MKTVLLIFMAFNFDAGATHEKVVFDSQQACFTARATVIQEYNAKIQNLDFGRPRLLAVCVSNASAEQESNHE